MSQEKKFQIAFDAMLAMGEQFALFHRQVMDSTGTLAKQLSQGHEPTTTDLKRNLATIVQAALLTELRVQAAMNDAQHKAKAAGVSLDIEKPQFMN